MPTGYTADLHDGKPQTFKQFVIQCARNFGACIEMRDEPWDKPIPDAFPYNDYHDKQLERAREELADAESMTLAQAEARAMDDYDRAVKAHRDGIDRCNAIRERYTNMLDQVNRWNPPTPEHQGLKDFMIQQLTESIGWDCKIYPEGFPEKQTAKKWLDELIERRRRDVAYHMEGAAKERARVDGNNRWVKDLRKSLEGK